MDNIKQTGTAEPVQCVRDLSVALTHAIFSANIGSPMPSIPFAMGEALMIYIKQLRSEIADLQDDKAYVDHLETTRELHYDSNEEPFYNVWFVEGRCNTAREALGIAITREVV